MIPPTSIDGTDITGATIDGTDVQEITVDGQTVFTAGVSNPVAEANLEHWIQFRGSANDLKGNMGTLVANGNPTIQASGGVDDPYTGGDGDDSQYAELDGNDSYETSSSGIFINDNNDLTTMIWVRPDQSTGEQRIIDGDVNRLFFAIDGRGTNGFSAFKFDGSFASIIGGVPDTTKWTHLCLTWDKSASTMEFYEDGVSQGTTSVGLDQFAFGFYIGEKYNGGLQFDGGVDDFRHYNTVLNNSQINEIITNTDPN
jgi:hypothetical protein